MERDRIPSIAAEIVATTISTEPDKVFESEDLS